MNIAPAFIANQKPSEAVEPGKFALGDPSIATQPFARLDSLSRDARYDASLAKSTNVRSRAISEVAMKFRRPAARTPSPSAHGLDAVDHRSQRHDVRYIGRREHRRREGRAVAIRDHVVLRAWFPAIGRVRTGLRAPFFAGAWAESSAARDQSILPACCKCSSSTWCTRVQTPAACHSRSRFQQVIPVQPNSTGRYSHGIPVRKTNTIPVSTSRSGARGRPPFGLGACLGSSGSMIFHNPSSTSRRAMLWRLPEACPSNGQPVHWPRFF
jgi:hypothetical protein